jgi:hypothetical protein
MPEIIHHHRPVEELRQDVLDRGYIREEPYAYAASDYPEPGPCPVWCTEPAGHNYDEVHDDLETWTRYHATNRNGPLAITQEEENRGGKVTWLPVVVAVYHNNMDGMEEVDSAELRLRAAEMLRFADHYDEIVAARS